MFGLAQQVIPDVSYKKDIRIFTLKKGNFTPSLV